MRKYSDQSDVHIDVRSGILKNKLGLDCQQDLDLIEGDVVAQRTQELLINPIHGDFDLPHLQAIHRKLFGDIYEWAGEIRTVDISKGDTYFAHFGRIEEETLRLSQDLKSSNFLKGLDPQHLAANQPIILGS